MGALATTIADRFGLAPNPIQSRSGERWYEGDYLRVLHDTTTGRILIANELDLGGPLVTIERADNGSLRVHVPQQASSLLVDVARNASEHLELE